MPNAYRCFKCHISLAHVVGNMYKCSKCGTVYWDKDLMKSRRKEEAAECKCGSRRFKYDPVQNERICLNCGLVT